MLPSLLAASVLALPVSSLLLTAPVFRQINGKPQALDENNLNKIELNARCVECPFPQFTNEPSIIWEDGFDSLMVWMFCLLFTYLAILSRLEILGRKHTDSIPDSRPLTSPLKATACS